MTHGSGRRTLPATVLAIMLTLLALAGCSSGRKSGPAQPTPTGPTAAPISPHLPFGNPSQAGTDPNNRLVLRRQFAASWNARKRNANWVAWRLTAGDIGDTERSQFYSDPEIDTPSPKDYTRSGYDRGHLCPSKDRSDTPENNKAVFTMLNIIPQAPENNRGPWEQAERFERSLAQAGREVYLIAGGAGSQSGFDGLFSGINVPEYTWKVIVALEKGKSFPDGQEQAQVFAILMPNHDGIKQDRWQQYLVRAAEIERQTGYNLFNSPTIKTIADRTGR